MPPIFGQSLGANSGTELKNAESLGASLRLNEERKQSG